MSEQQDGVTSLALILQYLLQHNVSASGDVRVVEVGQIQNTPSRAFTALVSGVYVVLTAKDQTVPVSLQGGECKPLKIKAVMSGPVRGYVHTGEVNAEGQPMPAELMDNVIALLY